MSSRDECKEHVRIVHSEEERRRFGIGSASELQYAVTKVKSFAVKEYEMKVISTRPDGTIRYAITGKEWLTIKTPVPLHETILWAFTEAFDGNWFPLTWLSHMLDVELHGLEPGGHHATSVALHAVNTLLLLAALLALTRELWPSAFVAAVFAVHPLHVESVAWAPQGIP